MTENTKKVSTDTQTDEQTYLISRLIHSVSKCLTLKVITRMIDERHESKKNHSFVNKPMVFEVSLRLIRHA